MDPKGRINDIEKNIYLPVLLIPSLNKNSCILSYKCLDVFIFHQK
jgi:hypothetical protein